MKNLLSLITIGLFLVSCSSTPYRESTSEYVDNSAISTKVKSKLLANSATRGTAIDVESFKGTVILSGFVNNQKEKEKALTIARETEGVREVKEALILKTDVEKMSE